MGSAKPDNGWRFVHMKKCPVVCFQCNHPFVLDMCHNFLHNHPFVPNAGWKFWSKGIFAPNMLMKACIFSNLASGLWNFWHTRESWHMWLVKLAQKGPKIARQAKKPTGMKSFHPLCQMHSHADVWNSVMNCAEFAQDCGNSAHKKLYQTYFVGPRKIFHWLSLPTWKMLLTYCNLGILLSFIGNFPSFLDLFGLFDDFVDLFGLFSPVTCAKIPSCTTNSMAQMHQFWLSDCVPNS